jgi:hypothetical protein
VTLPCVRVHVLAIRWGLVRPYCDGASLLSCRGIPTLRSVSLLLTMELAHGRRRMSRLRLCRLARKVGKELANGFLSKRPANRKSENGRINTGDLWWAWVDLNHRPRPYQGLLWCYMHSSVAMITLRRPHSWSRHGMIVGSRLPVPSRVEITSYHPTYHYLRGPTPVATTSGNWHFIERSRLGRNGGIFGMAKTTTYGSSEIIKEPQISHPS